MMMIHAVHEELLNIMEFHSSNFSSVLESNTPSQRACCTHDDAFLHLLLLRGNVTNNNQEIERGNPGEILPNFISCPRSTRTENKSAWNSI